MKWVALYHVHMSQRNPLQVPSGHMYVCEYA